MKVLFISGREPEYVRNSVIVQSLRKVGMEILPCTDSSPSYAGRYINVLKEFVFRRKDAYDFVFVGFFGQPLVPIIRKFTDKPILFDAFVSAYDTLCFDRNKFRPGSPAGRLLYWLDKHSCVLANRVILDTDAHIRYFTSTFGLPDDKFQRVFVGADDALFSPGESRRAGSRFRVFYYCSFLPLHGAEYVIHAAKRLERIAEIEFEVVGKGPQHHALRKLASHLGTRNITFTDWVPYRDLPARIAAADICLGGHFSGTAKARRVIAGKVFQFIAMNKPVIVGDCPANRELFTNRSNALFAKMADAGSLANAILELREDEPLRLNIAEEGYKTYVEKCSLSAIGEDLKMAIEQVI